MIGYDTAERLFYHLAKAADYIGVEDPFYEIEKRIKQIEKKIRNYKNSGNDEAVKQLENRIKRIKLKIKKL